MKNKEIAELLYEIAELLSMKEENPFKIRAYEKASQVIESFPQPIEDIKEIKELKKIPGIGESIAEKIIEYLETGKLSYLENLKKGLPEGLLNIMSIPGMGPKKAKLLFDKFKISSIDGLKEAATRGKLRELHGFGEKTEKNILRGIEIREKSKGRILLSEAMNISRAIIAELGKSAEIRQITEAGSIRRRKETIGDIDILCTVVEGKENEIIGKFVNLGIADKIISKGETKAAIITRDGVHVDLRVLNPEEYGAALVYFTGSREHNIRIREIAGRKGMTINEYGVFNIKNKAKSIAGKTEKEVYESIGLCYIPPELREDRGEIEIAAKGEIPELAGLKDIKGDTHVHSRFSDGSADLKEIAGKAARLNLEWVIVTDHSQSLKIAGGLTAKQVFKKIDEIRKYNESNSRVKLLCGAEVDLLNDGKLDYSDEILKEMDFVCVSIHSGFKQTEEQITRRVTEAFKNKYVNVLCHPTGRIIGKRDAYMIDMAKVLEEARKNNIALEINSFPERMDLQDIYCRKAKEMGIKMSIGTDAHILEHMDYLELGVFIARRGWLQKQDIINTMPYDKLIKFLKLKR